MRLKILVLAMLMFSSSLFARPSINEIQGCQALLDFVGARLVSVGKYNEESVRMISQALETYNVFLQEQHVTPMLKAFTNGDAAMANAYQTQIDSYKANVVSAMEKRYSEERIFTDHAVAIDRCYSKAPMSADNTSMMSDALQALVTLAQQN